MAGHSAKPSGPNFAKGLPLSKAPNEEVMAGHVDGEPVLLSRFGGKWGAVGGLCTHYGAPLADGLVLGETIHCPWHHACFNLRSGEALAAPAFDPLQTWKVSVEGDVVFVRERGKGPRRAPAKPAERATQKRIVIVGGGAAGFAAAEMLRRRGHGGALTMLSADADPPCDRPNLSKDYLAGTAPEDWIPLKPQSFYRDRDIDLRLGATMTGIAADKDQVILQDGERLGFDALLLATGAEPVRLSGPGLEAPGVMTLRAPADARAIIAAIEDKRRVSIVGASFIGLEVAAALRTRGLEVHVIAPETIPMERTLGRELGAFIRTLHEANGVVFHLGRTVEAHAAGHLRLSGGEEAPADLVVLGVGVRPRTELAAAAGIAVDRGVTVDCLLETSRRGVFAAGDVARYPDARTGELIRVEHWVAAERQGQAAALNMLGEHAPFVAPPFFWSNHYDASIRYVGHAQGFDRVEVDGSIAERDATVRYFRGDELLAAASIGRDLENLAIEAAFSTAGSLRRAEPLRA
jgi:NADPH-dependent 2,4-dienoyl-CoA reductase/sulfur reductase-like enzyme/nitrite reductase/ring-hydroxylating ferredoxin subunit